MEMQRQRLKMFTSCGWFFDRPTGLETTQILRYAGRAISLSESSQMDRLRREFDARMDKMFQVSEEPSEVYPVAEA